MGFLDHSTNNIILDAVLTDYGRRKLASGGGGASTRSTSTNSVPSVSSFIISQYALGDDEVNYKIIEKYGRAVGKEKIEKNTPIFEALTNQDIALKYKLVARQDSTTSFRTTRLPNLELKTSASDLVIGTSGVTEVILNLKLGNSTYFDTTNSSLLQGFYTIKISNRFFTIDGLIPKTETFDPGNPNQVTEYTYAAGTTGATSETVRFTVKKRTLDNTTLSVYGKRVSGESSNVRQIDSSITVTGKNTGVTLTFPISIKQTLST
jgi:hypothetical protein